MHHFDTLAPKEVVTRELLDTLTGLGFSIADYDPDRPWGAFFRFGDHQIDKFIREFFNGVPIPQNALEGERSPKLLLIAPQRKLSWQHHDRRGEFWRVIAGRVGVVTSDTDQQPLDYRALTRGETIHIAQGKRHRLIGLDTWAIVAEIWIHTDDQHLSNEEDIHRVQDDFGRGEARSNS